MSISCCPCCGGCSLEDTCNCGHPYHVKGRPGVDDTKPTLNTGQIMSMMSEAKEVFDECGLTPRQLSDEIKRLKRNIGCARNQGTTQFCHEAVDIEKRVAELTRQRDEIREALDTLLCVVGLTAFKYEGQRKALQEACDLSSKILAKYPKIPTLKEKP